MDPKKAALAAALALGGPARHATQEARSVADHQSTPTHSGTARKEEEEHTHEKNHAEAGTTMNVTQFCTSYWILPGNG